MVKAKPCLLGSLLAGAVWADGDVFRREDCHR